MFFLGENRNFCRQNIDIINSDLQRMLLNKPEKIVLGCTHYPFLTKILAESAPIEMLINPAKKFAELIKKDLMKFGLTLQDSKVEQEFYVSKDPEKFVHAAQMFYPVEKMPILKYL